MPVDPPIRASIDACASAWSDPDQGAFIGAVHRIAVCLDDRYELLAAALSSNADAGWPPPKNWIFRRNEVSQRSRASVGSRRFDSPFLKSLEVHLSVRLCFR